MPSYCLTTDQAQSQEVAIVEIPNLASLYLTTYLPTNFLKIYIKKKKLYYNYIQEL